MMKSKYRLVSLFTALVLLAWLGISIPSSPVPVYAQGEEPLEPPELEPESAEVVSLFWHPASGSAERLGTNPIEPAQLGLSTAETQDAKQLSLTFLDQFSSQLQVDSASTQWAPFRESHKDTESHVYLRQTYQGVPVFAGEVAVHIQDGAIVAANGEYLSSIGVSIKPELSVEAAFKRAIEEIDLSKPMLYEDRLVIYNPALLDAGPSRNHLAYHLTVDSSDAPDIYVVLVDAHSGKVLLSYNDLQSAKNRRIYDLNGSTSLPGTLCYTESGPQGSVSADCIAAFNFTGDTYDYYRSTHGRDSYDNHGATMRASVRYGTQANAFWNGTQTAYGPGFATKDVVAHEWTHAVTRYTANLVYSYQSGALNEAMSDVFGAMIDRDDWTMGEDTPIGVIRSLSNPNAYNNPARVGDSRFYCGSGDRGGVHINSTVPSHAAYWMSVGGTFNGQTMAAITRARTERIYYRALTVYLTSGSNFADARNALNSSCSDLYGAGSTVCTSVNRATRAVEMDQPVCGVAPTAPDAYEPDDTSGQARAIATDGTAQTHNFHDAGDNDWVRFSATAGCNYVVATNSLGSGSDTVAYLYASNGTTQLAYDDDGGPGLASRIAFTAATTGRHYVRIRHYSSSTHGPNTNYDLSVTRGTCSVGGDAYEPDNSRAAARPIAVNGAAQRHNFHVAGDNDWVRFGATAGRPYVIATSNLGSRSDTYLYLYNSGGTLIRHDDDGGPGLASRIEWTPSAGGTYYVRVRHFSSAVYGSGTGYDLRVTAGASYVDRYEVDDSASRATTISVGSTQTGHTFHDAGDNDWTRFAATASCSYVIETLNLGSRSDTYMYLYGTDGSTLITYDDDSGPGWASRIAWTARANGTYFIRVRHYSSYVYGQATNYDLRVRGVGCGPTGDSYEDDDVAARASTITVGSAGQSHNFHDAGDNDWVRFAAQVGVNYTIETSNLGSRCDTYMYLYDTNGSTLIAYDDDGGAGLASRIAWTAPRNGTYYIRLRHYSSYVYGSDTGYRLTVVGRGSGAPDRYEDDDVAARARAISGTQADHNFHDAGDNDWARFSASAGTQYVIETLNLEYRSDTYLYLYATNGSTLLRSDDDGGVGLASRIVWTAPASGTYYLRVRHYSSAIYGANTGYDLRVIGSSSGADPYEPDDSYTAARPITVNGSAQTHNFHDAGDNDWVYFQATAGGTYVMETFNLGPWCDTVMYLYRPNGTTIIAVNDDGGVGLASRISWTADATGRYFVRVRQYGNQTHGPLTNYSLRVVGTSSNADAYEPDNTPAQASTIAVNGSSQAHNFHVAGDNDWVRFSATQGGNYVMETFNLCSSSDTYLYLYNSSGSLLAYNDDGGTGLASRIQWSATASGTYYMRVRHYSSYAYGTNTCYNLRVTGQVQAGDAYEPDNVYTQARSIAVNGASQTHNFHVSGDRDWIRFSATAGCRYVIYTYNLGSRSDTYLYLYDRNGTTLLRSDDDGGTGLASRIEWTAPASGTYYAMVRHYSSAYYGTGTNYTIRVTGTCSSGGDAYEPDDTQGTARTIATNGTRYAHTFHDAGDQDWSRFSVGAGTYCVMATSNLGSRCDTYMYLYSAGGTLLAYDDDGGPGYASRIAGTFNVAGTYYLRVRHYSSSMYGTGTNYDLSVTCAASADAEEPEDSLASAGTIAAVELPIATAREGGEIEAIVQVNQETRAVKVETLVKPEYLELVEAVPLAADGTALDAATSDEALQYPDRWQVTTGDDGLASVWYAGKGEWDGMATYPVIRVRWRLVAPLPGEMAIPFVVTAVNSSGEAATETVYGIVGPHVSEPKIDAVTPETVYNGADARITIQGSDFVDTPKVYLRAGSDNFQLENVQFLSDEGDEVQLLQATVPVGTKPGIYKLVLENPDGGTVEFESIEVTDQWSHKIYLPLSIR